MKKADRHSRPVKIAVLAVILLTGVFFAIRWKTIVRFLRLPVDTKYYDTSDPKQWHDRPGRW